MTDPAKLAVDAAYQVHGWAADYTPPAGSTATSVLVIDNIADHIVALTDGDKPGAIALKPTVNIREIDLGGETAQEGELVLTDERWADRRNTTWTVKTSLRLNAYERQLTLAQTS
jgi:hypothetical protein